MSDKKVIYTLTAFQKAEIDKYGDIFVGDFRCLAWFETVEDAREGLKEMTERIADMHYDFCLIEAVESGLEPSVVGKELYYFEENESVFAEIDAEEYFGRCYALSIG